MLPRDFNQTFNAAVELQDWSLVIILGESAVAENAASKDTLYNLGLAYLKTAKAPMAVSVFLSVPPQEQDASFMAARDEALRLVGSSKEDLEVGAHGFTGAMNGIAQSLSSANLYGWGVTSFGFVLALWVLILFGQKLLYNESSKMFVRLALLVSLLLAAGSGLAIGVSYFYQSHWGAIVSTERAAVRPVPSDSSDPLKTLNPGKPVLVLGNVKTPWVRVIDADGGSGWMNALDLRVIHE